MRNLSQKIIALLAILNIMFVPIFDVWGGLFPYNVQDDFWHIMRHHVFGYGGWNDPTILTMFIFIPTAIMFIFALLGLRKATYLSAVCGVFIMIIMLLIYISATGDLSKFDFYDGNISIGTWTALLFFIAMLFTKRNDKAPVNNDINEND